MQKLTEFICPKFCTRKVGYFYLIFQKSYWVVLLWEGGIFKSVVFSNPQFIFFRIHLAIVGRLIFSSETQCISTNKPCMNQVQWKPHWTSGNRDPATQFEPSWTHSLVWTRRWYKSDYIQTQIYPQTNYYQLLSVCLTSCGKSLSSSPPSTAQYSISIVKNVSYGTQWLLKYLEIHKTVKSCIQVNCKTHRFESTGFQNVS